MYGHMNQMHNWREGYTYADCEGPFMDKYAYSVHGFVILNEFMDRYGHIVHGIGISARRHCDEEILKRIPNDVHPPGRMNQI